MTAPVLAYKKFYIIKPAEGTNQIKNPQFSGPEYVTGWAASGAGVTIASHPDDARRGAYSLKVNTANNVASGAYHGGLSVVSGSDYTFSCDVKGGRNKPCGFILPTFPAQPKQRPPSPQPATGNGWKSLTRRLKVLRPIGST